ncbi:unnamed protein product [Orchesella dallaii]|uniref:Uncharacterized protein n=1 Tax=Orchesella dallaii TaxID=48710 RepID=A0ABP1R9I6_9HEXA
MVASCTVLNQCNVYKNYFPLEKYMPSFNPDHCLRIFIADLCAATLVVVFFIFTFIYLLYNLYNPFLPLFYWNWTFFEENFFRIETELFLATAFWYGANHVCLIIEFHIITAIRYLNILYLLITAEFRVPGRNVMQIKNQHTLNSLREWQNYIVEYRSFEVMHTHVMEFYSPFIVLFNVVVVQNVLFCNVMLFTRWSQLSTVSVFILVFWSVASQVCWIFILEMGARLFVQGDRTIKSWKDFNWGSRRGNKVMKKFGKSCRSIRLAHGSMFTIRKRNVLTFLKSILRGTFRAFLAFKK